MDRRLFLATIFLLVQLALPTEPRKRSLLFPAEPAELLLILGLGTPLQLDRESVIVGAFTKFIYHLPSNVSHLGYPNEFVRQQPETRWSLYRRLGKLAELYGFAEGRACVMRAICETAAAPFEPAHGLLQQLLQLFFTPSSTGQEPHAEYQDQEYEAAEKLGAQTLRACQASFQHDCPASLLDVFTNSRLED